MTERQKLENEFFQEAFLPQIAVCCSYDAEVICRKNNLTFVELIQPFSKYNGEIKIFDPSNNPINIKKFQVEIKDINYKSPQPLSIKKILDSCVICNNGVDDLSIKVIENNIYKISTNTSTPWFENWRDKFIKYCIKEDHEFIRNFLGCIFVVSTSHLDPLDQFQKLIIQEQTDSSQNTTKKWFFPNFANVFKYFVLLHDVQEGEISKAHSIYESLKNAYGSSNCHLLQINSKTFENHDSDKICQDFDPWSQYCKLRDYYTILDNSSLDENTLEVNKLETNSQQLQEKHGMCLSLSDHDRIKTFFSEFLTRGLIPYAEKTIRVLNEQFQSKKNILKGFSLSKKFFGLSNSTSAKASTSPVISLSNLTINSQDSSNSQSKATSTFLYSSNQYVHSNDDLNTKRLGDIAFLFQLYSLSQYYYLSFKKDFDNIINSVFSGSDNSYSVKLYLANVLEMASISNYLNLIQSNTPLISLNKNYGTQYIEEALQIYVNECKNVPYSIRCILFSVEIFRAISNYSKAANLLINVNTENDLQKSLFLEQAAYCNLVQYQPNFRKYAFLMTLAAENFEKIGKDFHSTLAYKSGLQVYSNKAWIKVLEQINYSLSCQNYKLNNIDEALQYIEKILLKKKTDMLTSKRLARQYELLGGQNFLNESLILKKFIDFSNTLKINSTVTVQVPTIDSDSIKIILNPTENYTFNTKMCINTQESLEFFRNYSNSNDLKETWKKLEEAFYFSTYGTLPSMFFKPQIGVFDGSIVNNYIPTAVCNELIEISVNVINNLNVDLILKDCVLLWKFVINEENNITEFSNEEEDNQMCSLVETYSIDKILIKSNSEKEIRLLLKPKKKNGNLRILGVKYKLGNDNESMKLSEFLLAKQLFRFKEKTNYLKRKTKIVNTDNCINIKIMREMPLLQVNIDNIPEMMLCNQIHKFNIVLINLNEDTSIGNIKFIIDKSSNTNIIFNKSDSKNDDKNFKMKLENKNTSKEYIHNLENVIIKPKQKVILETWIQTNEIPGKNFFNFLIGYQEHSDKQDLSDSKSKKFEYRTVRFRLIIENVNMMLENRMRIRNFMNDGFFIGNIEINCVEYLDEISVFNIFSISEFWKITSFKKERSKNLEKFGTEKFKKISFAFKAEAVNSSKKETIKIGSLNSIFLNTDSNDFEKQDEVNVIVEKICENKLKYISDRKCLVLYFLIKIRREEKFFFVLREIVFSNNELSWLTNENQIDTKQNYKLSSYLTKMSQNNSFNFKKSIIFSH